MTSGKSYRCKTHAVICCVTFEFTKATVGLMTPGSRVLRASSEEMAGIAGGSIQGAEGKAGGRGITRLPLSTVSGIAGLPDWVATTTHARPSVIFSVLVSTVLARCVCWEPGFACHEWLVVFPLMITNVTGAASVRSASTELQECTHEKPGDPAPRSCICIIVHMSFSIGLTTLLNVSQALLYCSLWDSSFAISLCNDIPVFAATDSLPTSSALTSLLFSCRRFQQSSNHPRLSLTRTKLFLVLPPSPMIIPTSPVPPTAPNSPTTGRREVDDEAFHRLAESLDLLSTNDIPAYGTTYDDMPYEPSEMLNAGEVEEGTELEFPDTTVSLHVVVHGRRTGVFTRWTTAQHQVTGFSHNVHESFKDHYMAKDKWVTACLAGDVEHPLHRDSVWHKVVSTQELQHRADEANAAFVLRSTSDVHVPRTPTPTPTKIGREAHRTERDGTPGTTSRTSRAESTASTPTRATANVSATSCLRPHTAATAQRSPRVSTAVRSDTSALTPSGASTLSRFAPPSARGPSSASIGTTLSSTLSRTFTLTRPSTRSRHATAESTWSRLSPPSRNVSDGSPTALSNVREASGSYVSSPTGRKVRMHNIDQVLTGSMSRKHRTPKSELGWVVIKGREPGVYDNETQWQHAQATGAGGWAVPCISVAAAQEMWARYKDQAKTIR
ncbi:hypothetical protein BC629DRAFT_1442964 [Irpex lacteus]|nr:hypothetical protein BC629DRAFT_1442964 [Irpex lacteus]